MVATKSEMTHKQKRLFDTLSRSGELIFAAGKPGISANIVGVFSIREYGDEQRLDMGDGTNHVHVDWERVKRVEAGQFHGEGMLEFFDGDEHLFRLYRPDGDFPEEVIKLVGNLL